MSNANEFIARSQSTQKAFLARLVGSFLGQTPAHRNVSFEVYLSHVLCRGGGRPNRPNPLQCPSYGPLIRDRAAGLSPGSIHPPAGAQPFAGSNRGTSSTPPARH